MKYRTSSEFRRLYDALPANIQVQARKQFELVKLDPNHASLRFKKSRRRLVCADFVELLRTCIAD